LVENHRFEPTLPKIGTAVGLTLLDYRGDHWPHKTRVSGLSYGIFCVILHLAILIQYWHVMDRQTHDHS